ncbi:protein kinase domain-containing protein [Dapis sp. BLCC M172]|uniref:protein kinase domain-containing protein n=1 Tax=Dapis sp. BLCC M172 TaxID=2975281 RepID=UPI003CE8D4CE
MSAKIILTITEGTIKGQQFIFEERTTCVIGRSHDCYPQLPNDQAHRTISRYHCLLDINPPDIRVRDFGSKNGTYINGQKIGQRPANQTPLQAAHLNFPEYDLSEGDEIQIGPTVIKVSILGTREGDRSDFLNDLGTEDDDETIAESKVSDGATTAQFNQQEIVKNLQQIANEGEPNLKALEEYTIIKQLSSGECSQDYLILNEDTGELLVLKIMLPQVRVSQRAREMFLQEVENTKALDHPHIIKFQDYSYFNGTFFLTLEYCHGGTVVDLMQREGGKLSVEQALQIILQVLDGLEYAHNVEVPYVKEADSNFSQGRGLVHRDLKPHNIVLGNVRGASVAKMANYGLAKAFDIAGLSGQTMSGLTLGLPVFVPRQQVISFNYMKPEMDVWAMAATLYYMLTGAYPRDFLERDPFLVVLQTNAVPIRERDVSIPKRLAEVIDLGLTDTPEIYFKSAAQFKQALLNSISD